MSDASRLGDDVWIDTGFAGGSRDDCLVDEREPEPLGDPRGDLAHVGSSGPEKQTTRQLMPGRYGSAGVRQGGAADQRPGHRRAVRPR